MSKDDDNSLGKKVRNIEKEVAKNLVRWRLRRSGLPPIDEEALNRGTERAIDEAHKIVKKRSKSIFDELKLAKKEFQKAYRGEEEKD